MTSNSQTIIQDIRQEFEMLIEFVTGEQAQKVTTDQMERSLFSLPTSQIAITNSLWSLNGTSTRMKHT